MFRLLTDERVWLALAAWGACFWMSGCAVGWQINMPLSYSQAHSRGTSYNAASGKELSPDGTTEAFQQQRAITQTGDAMQTAVEADKATDLAAAKGQSAVSTETAKGARTGTGTATGEVSTDSAPTKSIAPSVTVAPGGLAVNSSAAPAASPGTTTATAAGNVPERAESAASGSASAQNIPELEADVANLAKVVELVGSGGGPDGADTPAQAKAKADLAAAKARLAQAKGQ